MLDEVLTPVAEAHELGDELGGVDLLPGRDGDRLDVFDMRTEALRQRADTRDDEPGARSGLRSRHITRRRRPMVSTPGLTRSNGNVSHAGNSSTSSAGR